MARFSKGRWPAGGPVRDLLSYLDELHRSAGQPSLTEMGRAVALAPSTLSAYFSGVRMITQGNLELLVEHLGGDCEAAERLRRRAMAARDEQRNTPVPLAPPQAGGWTALADSTDAVPRLDIVLHGTPVNELNRPRLLVGRQAMTDMINPWLDLGQRVLLYGQAGIGKTALAATIADLRVEAGKGSYLWLRTGLADEDVIFDGLARCVATATDRDAILASGGDGRLLRVQRAIATTGVTLCVLDDVWNPAAAHAVLRATPPGIGVLITSRFKLNVDHECEVTPVAPADAARLLAVHTRDDTYAWHPDSQPLCHELGNHPYAIEIAGHHLRQYGLDPGELRRRIAGSPHDLAMPAGFSPPGRESLRRLLDRTLTALGSDDARAALAAFGAFFSAGLTSQLLALYLGIDHSRARSALNALVDVSLAKPVPGTSGYVVHDLTLSYARALRTADQDDGKSIINAVRELVTAHAEDRRIIAAELDNILATAEFARSVAVDDFITIVEILATRGYFDYHGHTLGFLRLLDEAIAAMRGSASAERLHYMIGKRGNAHYNRGELAAAVLVYQEALALAPTPHRQAVLLGVIGKVLAELGEHEQANDHFMRAYAITEAGGDEAAMLIVLEQHSVAAFRRRDYSQVRELTQRGVALSRRLGERVLEATFLNNLGTADFELGVQAALDSHDQARAIAAELNNEHVLALTHRTLGADYQAMERHAEANDHFSEALRLYGKLGQTEREAKLRQLMQQFGYLR